MPGDNVLGHERELAIREKMVEDKLKRYGNRYFTFVDILFQSTYDYMDLLR
jgi:hypothetical protein